MTAHTPKPTEVETFSGIYVDTATPDPATIRLVDIAHALSQTCRYGGHSQRFYSVAEHAVFCSRRAEELGYPGFVCLAALHHDDAEAYLGDIPRPMKPLLGDAYTLLTINMNEAIVRGLRLEARDRFLGGMPLHVEDFDAKPVKNIDNWALFVEARNFLPSGGINWSGSGLDSAWDLDMTLLESAATDPTYWTNGLDPVTAEGLFLSRHHELTA